MPLISIRSPNPYTLPIGKNNPSNQRPYQTIDIIIVPAIGAKPSIVLDSLKSSQSYFHQKFHTFLAGASVSLFDFPNESTVASTSTTVIESYASLLLESLITHRQEQNERVPLHFVGHSTGGLVVKKALLMAEHEPRYSSVAISCSSLAFFGVPHRGSSIMSEAPFAESVKRVLALKEQMSEGLRNSINPESEDLVILATDFAFIARRMKRIWTFVENEDTKLETLASSYDAGDDVMEVWLPLVDKRSASLRIGNETIVDIGTSHAKLLSPSAIQSPISMQLYFQGLEALLASALKREDDLDEQIRNSIPVDLHLFYDGARTTERPSIKVWSVYPALDFFLSHGPQRCFETRLFQNNFTRADPSHLKIPMLNTKLDFSRRPSSWPRRSSAASIQAVSEDAVADLPSPPNTVPNDTTPSITISRPDTLPTITVSQTQPTSETPQVNNEGLRLPKSPSQNLSPDSSYGKTTSSSHLKAQDISQMIRSKNQMTFTLPDPSRRRFRWVHVPCNNMSWIPELMKCIAQDDEYNRQHLQETLLHESNLYSRQSVGRHGKPHSRHMKPGFRSFGHPSTRSDGEPGSSTQHSLASIFVPYLHWDSFKSLKLRNRLVKQVWSKALESSTKRGVLHGDSLEHKLIYQYLVDTANAPLHHRRSLDQYGYPDLRSTQARDEDQVLYKRRSQKKRTSTRLKQQTQKIPRKDNREIDIDEEEIWEPNSNDDEDGKVLMVDQLWCWVVGESTVLTCFPPKEDEEESDKFTKSGDLRNAIYSDINGDPRFATQCDNPFDLAALVISHATNVFIEDILDEDLQVFRVFEEYISILTEQHTISFKAFRDRYREQGAYGSFGQSGRRTQDTLSTIQEADLRANERDLTALLELRDIEDELNTIDKLFRDQLQVIEEAAKEYADWGTKYTQGHNILRAAISRVEGYRGQVENMQTNCKSAKESFSHLLEMKQTQANLAEAWAAREANAVASSQNRAVIGFTAVTIIFLPLGFFTSLFGMNTVDWTGNKSMPKLHIIFLWTFPVSCAVILITLLLAFNQFFRAIVVSVFQRYGPRSKRPGREDDVEEKIGLRPVEKDAYSAIRVLHSASVSVAGYGHIQPEVGEKKIGKTE